MHYRMLACVLALALCGCGSARHGDEPIEVGDELAGDLHMTMKVYPPHDVPRGTRFLGMIRSLSCMDSLFGKPASREGAIDRLLYRTRQAGGNAITNVNCDGERVIRAVDGCLVSVSCEASALHVPEAEFNPEKSGGSTGTGFVVSAQGHVLTNAHVVRGCTSISVRLADRRWLDAKLLAFDGTNDIAALTVSGAPASHLRFNATQRHMRGDHVVAIGFPLLDMITTDGALTTGTISALSGPNDDSRFMQFSAPIQPGNSGGPLLDQTGSIIGMNSATLNFEATIERANVIAQNVNFAIKDITLITFLAARDIPFETAQPTEILSDAEVGRRAHDAVALVECK